MENVADAAGHLKACCRNILWEIVGDTLEQQILQILPYIVYLAMVAIPLICVYGKGESSGLNSVADEGTILIDIWFAVEAVRLPNSSREQALQPTAPARERAIPRPPIYANVSTQSSTIPQDNIFVAIECPRNNSGGIEGMRGSLPSSVSEIRVNYKVNICPFGCTGDC